MVSLQSPEDVVPKAHPLRRVKQLADAALSELSGVFDAMYADGGRHSVPPERLLKATLLMALYTVRSERMLCEQLGYTCCFAGSWTWTWRKVRSTTARSRRTVRG